MGKGDSGKRRLADNSMLCYLAQGLWKRICKFSRFKSVSEGYTKANTEGKDNGVSRTVFTPFYVFLISLTAFAISILTMTQLLLR